MRSRPLPVLLVLLCLVLGVYQPVQGQSCTLFVNASDGSDTNPGTITQPFRSFEFAFNAAASGATLCVAAGEYFFGGDADGVTLSATNKSLTVVLEAFAGATEVRFSEAFFTLDIGTGILTFRPGSARTLAFGLGVLNTDPPFSEANQLNFLHTLFLRSGTLDTREIDVNVGASVGVPGFVNPGNATKVAPATARIERGSASWLGTPSYAPAARQIVYSGAGTRPSGGELPSDLAGGTLRVQSSGVTVTKALRFGDQASIVNEGTGVVRFDEPITITAGVVPTPIIENRGGGTLLLRSLVLVNTLTTQDLTSTLVSSGSGTLALERLSAPVNGSGRRWRVDVQNLGAGEVVLAVAGTPMTLRGALVNLPGGTATLAGPLTLAPDQGGGIALNNFGTLDLQGASLSLAGNATTYHNGGPMIAGPGGHLRILRGLSLTGEGTLPSITVEAGTPVLSTPRVEGSVTTTGTAGLTFDATQPLIITNLVTAGGTGTLTFPSAHPTTIEQELLVRGGRVQLRDQLNVAGNLSLQSGSTVALGTNGLTLGGNLDVDGAVFSGDAGLLILNGGRLQQVTSTAPLQLAQLHLLATGTHAQVSPALTLLQSLTLVAGHLEMSAPLRVAGTFSADAQSTLTVGTQGVTFEGDVLAAGATLSLGTAAVAFAGRAAQTLRAGPTLSMGSLDLEGSATRLDVVETNLRVRGNVTVGTGSTLSLGSNLAVLLGQDPSPVLANDGRITATGNGGLRLEGPGAGVAHRLQGTGVFGNMEIALASDLGSVLLTPQGSPYTVGGSLRFSVGNLDLQGQTLTLSEADGTPSLIRNLSDVEPALGTPDGGTVIDTAGGGSFNPAGTPYHLIYQGNLTAPFSAGPELQPRHIVDLTIRSADVINVPAQFGIKLPSGTTLRGTLRMSVNTVLDLAGDTLTLQHQQAQHVLYGNLEGGGTLRLTGGGSVTGTQTAGLSSRLDNLLVDTPAHYDVGGLRSLNTFTLRQGSVRLTMTAEGPGDPGNVLTTLHILGGELTLGASIDLGTTAQPGRLDLDGGMLDLEALHDIRLFEGGVVDIEAPSSQYPLIRPYAGLTPTHISSTTKRASVETPVQPIRAYASPLTSADSLRNRITNQGTAPQERLTLSRLLDAGESGRQPSNTLTRADRTTRKDGGFITFLGMGFVEAGSPIPRLKLDFDPAISSSDNVFLTDDATISEAFVMVNGDLFLGPHALTLTGGLWAYDTDGVPSDGFSDSIFGEFSSLGGSLIISGPVEALLGADVGFFASTLRIRPAPTDTVTFTTIDPQRPKRVILFDEPLMLEQGLVDLQHNDLELRGNIAPVLVASGGRIVGRRAPSFPQFSGLEPLDGTFFPFTDDAFGELILAGAGKASVQLMAPLEVSNLTLAATTRLEPGTSTLTLTGRMKYGQSGRQLAVDEEGRLVFASGAQLLRTGTGTLTQPPAFLGPVDVVYDLGDGSVSGTNVDFRGGTLDAGFELPSYTPIRNLIINAGGPAEAPNRVQLTGAADLTGSLILYGGDLDRNGHPVTVAGGGAIMYFAVDPLVPPRITDPGPIQSAGAVRLHYASRFHELTTTDAEFPATMQVSALSLDLGDPNRNAPVNLLLHATRRVGMLTVANNLPTATLDLNGHSLAVSSDAHFEGGSLTSGAVSTLDVGGDLTTAAGTSITGSLTLDINGHARFGGSVTAITVQVAGDLICTGDLGAGLTLVFRGLTQSLRLNNGNETVNRVLMVQGDPISNPHPTVTLSSDRPAPVTLTVNAEMSFQKGLFVTGPNTLRLMGDGDGFVHDTRPGALSHVVGRLRRPVEARQTEPTRFPLGSLTQYRPMTFEPEGRGFAQAMALTASHHDVPPLGRNGLPITLSGNQALQDVSPFSWSLSSTVPFTASTPFRMTLAATGLTVGGELQTLRALLREGGNMQDAWRVVAGNYDNTYADAGATPTIALQGGTGLSGQQLTFTIGVPALTTTRTAHIQVIHNASFLASGQVDVYLNGQLVLDNFGFRRATRPIPVALPQSPTHVFEVAIAAGGSSSVLEAAIVREVSVGVDDLLQLLLLDEGTAGLSVIPLQRTTTPPPADDEVVFRFIQGVPDLPPVDLYHRTSQRTLATALGHMSVTPPLRFSTGLHRLELQTTGTTQQLLAASLNMTDLGGTVVTVLASGFFAPPPGSESARSFNLMLVTTDGAVRLGSVITGQEPEAVWPHQFIVRGNYPNPFSETTTFVLDVPAAATFRVEVFDPLGRRVYYEEGLPLEAGLSRKMPLMLGSLAAGMYVYRLTGVNPVSSWHSTGMLVKIR